VTHGSKLTLAALVLGAVYFPLALWLKYSYVPPKLPPGAIQMMVRSFNRYSGGGFAFRYQANTYQSEADSEAAPSRSPMVIYEDGKPLGPAHSLHTSVVKDGNGRFSHWGGGFVFSSSDNSDPNLNGRQYWIARLPGTD
jgi:hypothetical protein